MEGNDKPDRAAVKIFPPGVPLTTVLIGLAFGYFYPISLGFELLETHRYWIGGLLVIAALLILGVWPLLMFRRSGQNPEPWKPTPEILERGPYRMSRNPMYMMMVLVCIGVSIILDNVWILILTPVCAWVLYRFAILPEEAYLKAKFGNAYEEYFQRVRRWI
jgi:protein-S-isoprenylcysteine O-methyltransferase Ste14